MLLPFNKLMDPLRNLLKNAQWEAQFEQIVLESLRGYPADPGH